MKTVAIIGASSMLGQFLVQHLRKKNIDIILIGRNSSDDILLDLEHDSYIVKNRLKEIDILFHCASSFENDKLEGIEKNIMTNSMSSLIILRLVDDFNINKIVYSGSISSDCHSVKENYTSYGLSKNIAEQIFSFYMKSLGKSFISLRFSQFCDFDGKSMKHQPWFSRIISYASQGLDLNIPKQTSLNNFLHVNDAAELMLSAAFKDIEGIFKVIHPKSYSYHEIAEMAYRTFEKGGKIVINSNKKPFSYVNFTYDDVIYQKLEVYPKWDIPEILLEIKKLKSDTKFGLFDVE